MQGLLRTSRVSSIAGSAYNPSHFLLKASPSSGLLPIRVATGFDEEGMMVLDEEQRLVVVLVRPLG
jgi:hypothetical protein